MRVPLRAFPIRSCLIITLAAFLLIGGLAEYLRAEETAPKPGDRASRLERIMATKKLRVCMWPGHHGISSRNPHTLEPRGIDVDLARELGKELGVEVEFIDSPLQQLPGAVLDGRCDFAMAPTDMAQANTGRMSFTAPHLASDIYAITPRGNRRVQRWSDIDQPGVIVAVIRDSIQETVMRRTLRYARVLAFPSAETREQAVESGRADVLMTSYSYSQHLVRNTDWALLISPDEPVHLTSYAWALAPGDEPWFQRVEQFIGAIKQDGRLGKTARNHGLEKIVITK
jgi:ABC-type amino acid transport substrate-binding protein